jgi:hypothetical protein
MNSRSVAGCWWFDWSGDEDGEHEIIARTRGALIRRCLEFDIMNESSTPNFPT